MLSFSAAINCLLVLHLVVGPWAISPKHAVISTGVSLCWLCKSHFWDLMNVTSPMFWPIENFCNVLCLLQKKLLWQRVMIAFICGRRLNFYNTARDSIFRKATVLESPPESMTPTATANYLGLQSQAWTPSYGVGHTSNSTAVAAPTAAPRRTKLALHCTAVVAGRPTVRLFFSHCSLLT